MIAPARRAAFAALRAIATGRSDLDTAIDAARRLVADPRDVALLRELVTGTLRWQGQIDAVLTPLCKVPLARLDGEVHTALRLGAYQLLHLDRVPAAAVVDDAVALVRAAKKSSATGLVNAVLRRVALERSAAAVLAALDDAGGTGEASDVAAMLARTTSHPEWLVQRWLARRSREDVETWLAFNNTPAPATVRVNALVAPGRDAVAQALAAAGVATEPCRYAPWGLVVRAGRVVGTPLLASGACFLQDEGSQLAALVAPVNATDAVLDLCASPGGKTLAYAAAAGPAGRVVAADVRARRVAVLAATLARGHAAHVAVVHVGDRGHLPFRPAFDVVAVDAPCSGLGTLRRDPDIKWRRTADDLPRFAAAQLALLERASLVVRPGGCLVYTTCSSEPDENAHVVARFLVGAPTFRLRPAAEGPVRAWLAPLVDAQGFLSTDPVRHGLECYFGAVLERAPVG